MLTLLNFLGNKWVIYGIVLAALSAGVVFGVHTYNSAITDLEAERGEKEKAVILAQVNAAKAQELADELSRYQFILIQNQQEQDLIIKDTHDKISKWQKRVAELEAAGDQCVSSAHPPLGL